MSRKVLFIVLLVVVLFGTITGSVVEAAGPGNGKGQAKGKANGHTKTEESAGSSQQDSGPNGSGNAGASWTRKGVDDPQQDQNIYQSGDTLSYHVSNRHAGENTITVKKPGKNGEIVFQTTVMVGADGNLDVVLTDIPEDWAGVYQVQISDAKGMKNDNINIKRPHVSNPTDLPKLDSPSLTSSDSSDDGGDCTTVVYHASGPEVTVVEFFKPEHAGDPWNHEHERLGEARTFADDEDKPDDEKGFVTAVFAGGETFVVFEYDEATGAYNYRGTGYVIAEGQYDGLVHIWSDGDAESTLFDILVWTPYGVE